MLKKQTTPSTGYRSHNGEETVSARSGLVHLIWTKFIFFRTNRAIPRGARAYCREDFREDVARRNINKMPSKIISASEVNTGFLSSVCIPNLRQGLLEHFLESSYERENVSSDSDVCSSIFFGQIQSRRLVRHVVRGIPQCSRHLTKRFTAQRYWDTKNKE